MVMDSNLISNKKMYWHQLCLFSKDKTSNQTDSRKGCTWLISRVHSGVSGNLILLLEYVYLSLTMFHSWIGTDLVIMRGVTHAHSCMHSIGVAIISGTMIPLRVMPLGAKAPIWEHQQFDIMTLPAHSLQGRVPVFSLAWLGLSCRNPINSSLSSFCI